MYNELMESIGEREKKCPNNCTYVKKNLLKLTQIRDFHSPRCVAVSHWVRLSKILPKRHIWAHVTPLCKIIKYCSLNVRCHQYLGIALLSNSWLDDGAKKLFLASGENNLFFFSEPLELLKKALVCVFFSLK